MSSVPLAQLIHLIPLDLAAPEHDARVRMPDLMAMSDKLSDKMLVTVT